MADYNRLTGQALSDYTRTMTSLPTPLGVIAGGLQNWYAQTQQEKKDALDADIKLRKAKNEEATTGIYQQQVTQQGEYQQKMGEAAIDRAKKTGQPRTVTSSSTVSEPGLSSADVSGKVSQYFIGKKHAAGKNSGDVKGVAASEYLYNKLFSKDPDAESKISGYQQAQLALKHSHGIPIFGGSKEPKDALKGIFSDNYIAALSPDDISAIESFNPSVALEAINLGKQRPPKTRTTSTSRTTGIDNMQDNTTEQP